MLPTQYVLEVSSSSLSSHCLVLHLKCAVVGQSAVHGVSVAPVLVATHGAAGNTLVRVFSCLEVFLQSNLPEEGCCVRGKCRQRFARYHRVAHTVHCIPPRAWFLQPGQQGLRLCTVSQSITRNQATVYCSFVFFSNYSEVIFIFFFCLLVMDSQGRERA